MSVLATLPVWKVRMVSGAPTDWAATTATASGHLGHLAQASERP